MKLEDSGIYPFIKDYPKCKILYRFGKGECITNSIARNENYWYVIEGQIEVVATSHNGRRIHVDDNVEDEWTGHLRRITGDRIYTATASQSRPVPASAFQIPSSTTLSRTKTSDSSSISR